MKRKSNKIWDEGPLWIDPVKRGIKMTPKERLKWLSETKRFVLQAMPKSTFNAMMRLREKQRFA